MRFFLIIYLLVSSTLYSIELLPGYHFSATLPFYTGTGFSEEYFDQLISEGFYDISNNPKLSMSFGVSFSFKISDSFFLQPELNINSNGGGVSGKNSDGEDFTYLFDERTVEIPLLIKLKIPLESRTLTLLAGPGLSMLVETPEIKKIVGYTFDTVGLSRDDFNFLGILLTTGIGYEIPFNNGILYLEGRYSYEITDTVKTYSGSFRQNCISLVLGYSLKLEDKVEK